MKHFLSAISVFFTIIAFNIGTAHANISFTVTGTTGTTYLNENYTDTDYAAQFNLAITSSELDTSNTFGFCVDGGQGIFTDGKTIYSDYSISSITNTKAFLQAAWIIDSYSQYTTNKHGSDWISAIQAAVWEVTGQNAILKAEPIYNFWNDNDVYDRYTKIMNALTGADLTGLDSKYVLLTSAVNQDLLIKASSVPVPAAAWMLGSGCLGLLAYRRRQA